MKIFLTGYMGSGKSTVGRMLARKLNFRFVDTDTEIEQRSGMTVGELFSVHGEAEFRQLEQDVLAEIIARTENLVVATGGGMPCFFDNMEVMNRSGLTVYLKMSPEKLAARLEHGKSKRPLLRDKSQEELTEFIRENIARREPCYNRAGIIIDGERVSDQSIAGYVERCITEKM